MPRHRPRGRYAYCNDPGSEDEDSDHGYAGRRRHGARNHYPSPSDEGEDGQEKEPKPRPTQTARRDTHDNDDGLPRGQKNQRAGTGAADVELAPARPTGWERRVDDKERTYWVNHDTRATTWDDPGVLELSADERPRQERAGRCVEGKPPHAGTDQLRDRPGVAPTSDDAEHNIVLGSQRSPRSDVRDIRPQAAGVAGGRPKRICRQTESSAEVGESEEEDEEAFHHTSLKEPVLTEPLDPLESYDDFNPRRSSSLSSMEDLPAAATHFADPDDDIQAVFEASRRYFEVKDADALERARAESLEAAEQAERKRTELAAELRQKEKHKHQRAITKSLEHAGLEDTRVRREEQEKRRKILQAIAENARLVAEHQQELEAKRRDEEREHDALFAENRRLAEENECKLERRRAEEALQYGYKPGETEEELLERAIRASLEEDMRRAAGLEAERKRLYREFGSRSYRAEQAKQASLATSQATTSPTQQASARSVSQSQQQRKRVPRAVSQEASTMQIVTEDDQVSTSGLSPMSDAPPTARRAPTVTHTPTTRTRSNRRTKQERRRPPPTEARAAPAQEAGPVARPSSASQGSATNRGPSVAKPLPNVQSPLESSAHPSAVGTELERAASAAQSLSLDRLSRLTQNRATEPSSATGPTARHSMISAPPQNPRSSQLASQDTLEPSSEDPDVARAPGTNSPTSAAPVSGLTPEEQTRGEIMLREALRLSAGEIVKDPEDGIDDAPPSYQEALAAPRVQAPTV